MRVEEDTPKDGDGKECLKYGVDIAGIAEVWESNRGVRRMAYVKKTDAIFVVKMYKNVGRNNVSLPVCRLTHGFGGN